MPKIDRRHSAIFLASFLACIPGIGCQKKKPTTPGSTEIAAKEGKAEKQEPEFIELFDGKSLADWKPTRFGGEGRVLLENETIVIEMGAGNLSGITYTKDFPLSNYEIELEAKAGPGQ